MFSAVNQSDSDARMASVIFSSSDDKGANRESQLLAESVQMETDNTNLDPNISNSAEPAVHLKIKFENSSGPFASLEIPANSTIDVQSNRNPNETITKSTNDFSSHRHMISGSRKVSNTDAEDPSVKVASPQNQHQGDQKDVEIVHEIITLPEESGKMHKPVKQVKSPTPPPPALIPVPVSVINTNPTLAALLNGGTPKRNVGQQKISRSTARNGKSQPNQSLNFKFGSNSDINIRDFLADSSNYTLTPVVNTASATNDMLLNYDKSRYTAIPLEAFGSVNQPNKSFTILGYNILNVPPAMVGASQTSYSTAPLSYITNNHTRFEEVTGNTNSVASQLQFQPQYQYQQQQQHQQPSMSNSMGNSLRTIVLECNEAMPQESSDPDGSHISEESGSVNGNMHISKNGGSFTCNICKDRYYTKEYLDYHLIVVHNIRFVVQQQQQPAPMQISPAYSRNECNRVEKNSPRAILQPGHTLSRHFFCNLCSKSYAYLRNLKKHEITVHSAPTPECSQLNKTNGSPSLTAPTTAVNIIKPPSKSSPSTLGTTTGLLGTHFAPVPVPTNSQSTSRNNTVKNEIQKPKLKPQVHPNPSSPAQSQCQVCHEILADRGALLIHTKQHVSTCSVCFKIFGSPRGLKLHSSVHFENRADKPYRCELCDNQYSHSRSLKHHMRRHSSPTMEPEQQQQQQEHEKINSLVLAVEGVGCPNECQIQVKEENNKEKQTNLDLDESDSSEYVSFCFGRIEETKD